MTTYKTLQEKTKLEQQIDEVYSLPLIIEIIPGQIEAYSILGLFPTGSWKGKTLKQLVKKTLENKGMSVEERENLNYVKDQLNGGELYYKKGARKGLRMVVANKPINYAAIEKTEDGDEYLYVALHAIKPDAGGGI